MSQTEQDAPEPEPAPPAEAASEPEPEANPLEAERDKALAEMVRHKAAARDTERRFRQLEAKFRELEEASAAREQAWREDPYKAAEEFGGNLRGWADRVADGEDALTPEQQQMRAIQAKLDAIDAKEAEAKKAAADAEQAETVQREIDHIKAQAAQDADAYGLLDAMGLHQAAHARFYERLEETGEAPDLGSVMAEVVNDAATGLRTIASTDAGIRALLADEATAQKLREALGVGAAPAVDTDAQRDDEPAQQADGAPEERAAGGPVLTQTAASRPGRRAHMESSEEDRRRRSKRIVRRMQERSATG